MRTSILRKVLAAQLLALLIATLVVTALEVRLTRSVLDGEAAHLAKGRVDVLEQAYEDRLDRMIGALTNFGQLLYAQGLTEAARIGDLTPRLALLIRNLDLDVLQLIDNSAAFPTPIYTTAERLAEPLTVTVRNAGIRPPSRLVRTTEDRYVQEVAIPIDSTAGATRIFVAGARFDSRYAYLDLRPKLEDQDDDVILVAGGKVVGETIPEEVAAPPGATAGRLPTKPMPISIRDTDGLVVYAGLSGGGESEQGAIGVVVPRPVEALEWSLARHRWLTTVLFSVLAVGSGWLLFRKLTRPLVDLAHTAGQIAEGDLKAQFDAGRGDETDDEVGKLASALEHMRVELRTKLKLVEDQAAGLKESSNRIVAAQDEERHRLARDLHDGLQQQLVVLRMGLGMAKESAQRLPEQAGDLFDDLGHELDQIIQRLREVTQDLYPSILLDRGLTSALHSYLGRLPISARLTCNPNPLPRLAPEIESGAYFLLAEALTNALKHSGASNIEITVELHDGSWLLVTVADDGRGFPVGGEARRGGLLHMEDRARSLGGELMISSEPGQGTRVMASFVISPLGRGVRPRLRSPAGTDTV
ncbi:MAG: histidine kinase [Actinomycetota bacterium]